MMKEEFMRELRSIPGHENDAEISLADWEKVQHVYMWHPAIPNVGGKSVIAHIYAYGGIMTIVDMLLRANKAEEADRKIREIRRDISVMEKHIAEIMAEVCA